MVGYNYLYMDLFYLVSSRSVFSSVPLSTLKIFRYNNSRSYAIVLKDTLPL